MDKHKQADADREPWTSDRFRCEYDDREKFPFALIVVATGEVWKRYMRRFVAHSEAKKLDKLIDSVLN